MNVDDLHRLTLDSKNAESSVTVNQRALIDKVLARYSSENTLLRELLQNSDDANATSVAIKYESAGGAKGDDINKRSTKRVIVRNNGQIFRAEDWSRLSRIAEGNPDEAKIGAFGVGFYSVFSICEDPFVTSGDTGLAFYWRNDQLFTRTAQLPIKDDWTSFSLNMRQEMELPTLRNLTQFLATALTFSRSLANIDLYLDDTNLCSIKKIMSPSLPVSIASDLSTTTASKMFRIKSVESASIQISATYLTATQAAPTQSTVQSKIFSFFSAGKEEVKHNDIPSRQTSTIFLRVVSGTIQSFLKSSFAAELQRATKKPAPKESKIQIVTVNAAEYASSSANASIFESLSSFPNQGRVYIGFPTHQTTGFSGHVGAPCLIPTVERESIDLVDRYIKIWNFEVLRAIGLLARISYHVEFAQVKTNAEAVHTMKFFSTRTATPQRIDQTIEEAFFTSSAVSVLSTQGVRPSTKTRLPDQQIRFLKSVPMLSAELYTEAKEFVDKLVALGYIEHISIGDIKSDIQNRVLTLSEGISFLKYCSTLAASLDRAALETLLRAAIIDAGSATINAGQISTYSNPKYIPSNVPLPIDTLPSAISDAMKLDELKALRWNELGLIDWLDFIVHRHPMNGGAIEKDINRDADFAIILLSSISRNFDALFADDRDRAVKLLQQRTCIPTRSHGMQKPDQTYFNSVKMFDDLPLVLSMKGVKDKFLMALGVRKTVELDIIFNRLVSGGSWTTGDVISYLASVKRDIPAKDLEKLKNTPLAVAEGSSEKRLARDLYEPNDTFRQLGLSVIAWKNTWRTYSEEATLLYQLGLQKFPSPSKLIEIAATAKEPARREQALTYFLTNYAQHGYGADYDSKKVTHDFIPTMSGKLARPDNVYTDPGCAVFGYEILRKDFLGERSRILGVQATPSIEVITNSLIKQPPKSQAEAAVKFGLFARLQPVFSREERSRLSSQAILPIERNGKLIRMAAPDKCFFRTAAVDPLYTEIFDFVDYGVQANQLLRTIGVRDTPSTVQIASMLIGDARNVWNLCGSETRYQQLLLQIARHFDDIKKDRALYQSFRQAKVLLAHKYVLLAGKHDEDDESNIIVQNSLQRAVDIVIVDDIISFNLFRTDIFTSPESALIEEMYAELGSSRLSSITLERPITNGRQITNERTVKLKSDLIERLTVFVSDPNVRPKRDIKWLQKNLSVIQIDSIAVQRTLRFGEVQVAKQTKTTAAIIAQGHGQVLLVSQDPDNYDIAVAICKFLLPISKPGDYLLLDSLLTKSLKTLKARGYNVDRILQRQEKERQERRLQEEQATRLYEQEQERLAMEQTKQIEAQARQNLEQQQRLAPMPGQFPDVQRSPKGLLSGLKKAVGIKTTNTLPSPSLPQQLTASSVTLPAADPVTSQAKIDRDLNSAIQATRSSSATSVFDKPRADTVAEAASYCDSKPAHNLTLAATLPNGMSILLDASLDASHILQLYAAEITQFSTVLDQFKPIFGITGGINIYFDNTGPVIAFNKGGTIYCNLRFFAQLHSKEYVKGNTDEARLYWFTTLCHEIAHNLVPEHSSAHEFYMESLICKLLPKLVPLLADSTRRIGPPAYAN